MLKKIPKKPSPFLSAIHKDRLTTSQLLRKNIFGSIRAEYSEKKYFWLSPRGVRSKKIFSVQSVRSGVKKNIFRSRRAEYSEKKYFQSSSRGEKEKKIFAAQSARSTPKKNIFGSLRWELAKKIISSPNNQADTIKFRT